MTSSSARSTKGYEYESLEELNSINGGGGKMDWERAHRSIPTSYSGSALNRLLTEDEEFLSRKYFNNRRMTRRSSDGGMTMTDYLADPSVRGRYDSRTLKAMGYDDRGDRKSILSRKPRSWHPSPYGSDEEFIEEDDILTREAKKQRIKAEIARRRQQIEQNSRLHDELVRLARLRECFDILLLRSVSLWQHGYRADMLTLQPRKTLITD